MSGHSFPILFKNEHSPNASFFQWLKSNSALFISQIAAMVSLAIYIGTFFYYVIGHDPNSHKTGLEEYLTDAKQVLFFLNICFCTVFVVASLYVLGKNEEGSDHVKMFYKSLYGTEMDVSQNEIFLKTAQKHLRGFKYIFLSYWAYALFNYLVLILVEEKATANTIAKVSFCDVKYLLFLMGNVMIIILYLAFIKMVKSKQIGYPYNNSNEKAKVNFWLKPAAPIFLFAAITGLSFVDQKWLGISSNEDWFKLINLFAGIIKMIVLSLLISRIDSKLIGLPSWLISILYVYAAIQPLDFTFTGDDLLSRCISLSQYAIAFFIKIYFFLVLTYAMQTGRMLNFFCCHGELAHRITSIRKPKKNAQQKTT